MPFPFPPYSFGNVAAMGGGSSAPPLPAFSNVVLAAALFNYNNAGYPAGNGFNASGDNAFAVAPFTTVAPYPADYDTFFNGGGGDAPGNPPYSLSNWYDQNSQANNLDAGAGEPTLQITTPVVVSGAGTSAANGTYRFNGLDGDGIAKYVRDASGYTIAFNQDDVAFRIIADDTTVLYVGGDPVSFPWQDGNYQVVNGAAPPPTVTASTQTGELQFNGSTSCLQSSGSVTLGTTATAYLRFKTTDVALTDILFEVGATPTATPFALSVRTVAGVLTVTVTDSTGLLFNTKTFNVSSNTWYVITVIVDTALTAANQVKLLVSNSATGVSAPVSTDLASGNLADGVLNVGARNQASSFFAGSATDLLLFSVAHTPTQSTAWYDYINQVLYP